MSARLPDRRLLGAVALGLLVLAVALALLLGRGDSPPATGAARLVPADALLYLHVSTDRDRDAVRRANRLLERFPSAPGAREAVIGRITSIAPGLSYARDVRPWLGKDAALVLLNTASRTAMTVAVVSVADREKAQAFLGRAGTPSATAEYEGSRIATYGAVSTALVRGYLVVGAYQAVRVAIGAAAGHVQALSANPTFRAATRNLPDDRAADAYLPGDGVTRLLTSQAGPLGAIGTLIEQPGLRGTALALSAEDKGARIRVRSVVDRRLAGRRQFPAFEPELVDRVPQDAMAYIGLAGLDRSAARLAGDVATGAGPALGALLARVREQVRRRSGGSLEREVLPLFRREVAVWLKAATPAPVLTLIAATDDEQGARRALAELQAPLLTALTPPGVAAGQAPVFEQTDLGGGVTASVLRLGPGVDIGYAVFDGKLVISTSLDGIRDVRTQKGSLAETPAFRTTLDGRPDEVTSLVFLDFSQLLRLGELTGLSRSPAYQAVRGDLRKVRALGAAASGRGEDSTTDLFLEIP